MDAVWSFLDRAAHVNIFLSFIIFAYLIVLWWAIACQMVDVIKWVKNLKYRKTMRRMAEIRKERLG